MLIQMNLTSKSREITTIFTVTVKDKGSEEQCHDNGNS